MAQYADLLSRIERQFGVPRELIMAIWTMETDNGTGDMGKLPVIRRSRRSPGIAGAAICSRAN